MCAHYFLDKSTLIEDGANEDEDVRHEDEDVTHKDESTKRHKNNSRRKRRREQINDCEMDVKILLKAMQEADEIREQQTTESQSPGPNQLDTAAAIQNALRQFTELDHDTIHQLATVEHQEWKISRGRGTSKRATDPFDPKRVQEILDKVNIGDDL